MLKYSFAFAKLPLAFIKPEKASILLTSSSCGVCETIAIDGVERFSISKDLTLASKSETLFANSLSTGFVTSSITLVSTLSIDFSSIIVTSVIVCELLFIAKS